MVRIIVNLFMIIGGIVFCFLTLHEATKKTIKINTKDNSVLKTRLGYQVLIDVITGFWFSIVGIISFLNILSDEQTELLAVSILLLIKIVEFIINKKYKGISWW